MKKTMFPELRSLFRAGNFRSSDLEQIDSNLKRCESLTIHALIQKLSFEKFSCYAPIKESFQEVALISTIGVLEILVIGIKLSVSRCRLRSFNVSIC